MVTEVGWEAAKPRLFALLEKGGFEYEVQSRIRGKRLTKN